ncbi:MerR family transcriptional regulator [Xanthobacter sp. VTT E-85241]|uniref:MerR family transcriptional regulator n=1 Tax=Roseixanthobacter finlandensis TaxID=3119922 RepID=UPI003726BAED
MMMLIGEVARLSGLSKDGIRHYEQLGLIGSIPRRAGTRTYRDYDASVLPAIERVKQAQHLGLSLAEIMPLLQAFGNHQLSDAETIVFLEERLTAMRGRIADLSEIARFIEAKLEAYRAGRGADHARKFCRASSKMADR